MERQWLGGIARDVQGETELCGLGTRAGGMATIGPGLGHPPALLTGSIFLGCALPHTAKLESQHLHFYFLMVSVF